ncbi:ubiquinone biosynthesis protein COQ4 [Chryseobacterium chendengshani]|uniref:Coq4 family protein n=1 Tax=Chryseobacterium sp. LJ668 TaxID=2864040 RepID=UPI001C6920FD|nr:Coq4 family protein [Chryseobacterium sp. LJ668]MBW8524559.1 ubiquinone biosynthesis protein COQ4 [Chryseobacterium sp. LJ668]QYK17282.1 ubiquinone biosynthesis protein COQ4 [Chryseobacterium sp. LJ668]
MKKIRIKFLLFVYDKTQKLYRKYFKKKKRQWQFNERQLLEFQEDSLGRKLGEFYKRHGFTMIPKMENHDVHHLLTDFGTNFEDEIAMQFLLLGNGKANAHLLAAIGLGIAILPEYYKMYISAYKKGRDMRTFYHVDFEELLWQNYEHVKDFFRNKEIQVFY